MTKDQLQEFFKAKREHAQPAGIDWQRKRDEWVRAVDQLYRKIEEDYLGGVRSEVQFDRTETELRELPIGVYKITELTLQVGDEQVVFFPKGVNIVGAKGRIDVRGERGDATIVWRGDNQWSLVASRTPTLQLVELNAESLGEMLRGIMRP